MTEHVKHTVRSVMERLHHTIANNINDQMDLEAEIARSPGPSICGPLTDEGECVSIDTSDSVSGLRRDEDTHV